MKLGIVGLPNVGKSTLFNSLTKAGAESANYPFCTIDPNVGIVSVPDERLKLLGDMYHSKKVTPAVIEFVDIAGLVKGASQGEGLGHQFSRHLRAVAALHAADMLIVGGTSLVVYPAAGMLRYFGGDCLVVINKQPTPADSMANLVLHQPIGEALGQA